VVSRRLSVKPSLQVAVHLPSASVDYCLQLISQHNIALQIVPSRKTVLGTYSRQFTPQKLLQIIRINAGLSPQLFLVVLLHEIAHWLVDEVGVKIEPHGKLWQDKFRELLQPVLLPEIFSESQLESLFEEIQESHTGACFTPRLRRLLDPKAEQSHMKELGSLSVGSFLYLSNKPFLLHQKRRSRALCLDLIDGRSLLINMESLVSEPLPEQEVELAQLASAFRPLGSLAKNQKFVYMNQPYILLGASPVGKGISFKKPYGKVVYSLHAEALVKVV